MIFLMYNMGNSGGSWFERVCNTHPKVHAWEELTRFLGNSPSLNMPEAHRSRITDKIATDFLKKKSAEYESVGLIKSFGSRTRDYCLENGGVLVQMFRHPLKVVNHKMGSKKRECLIRGVFDKMDTDAEVFEAHVEYYYSLYRGFHDRGILTLRLEDLRDSLHEGTPFFKETIEGVTGVTWSDEQIDNVRSNVLPVNRSSYAPDKHDKAVWESWSGEQRSVFKKYFDDLMPLLGYEVL